MQIKDNEKNLWDHAYAEALGWGFGEKGSQEHADAVVVGY